MEHENLYTVEKHTFRDNLRRKLFPPRHCEEPEVSATYQDRLVCKTWITLSWTDWLRFLLTGKILVETRTATEHIVGRSATKSTAYVLPPRWLA